MNRKEVAKEFDGLLKELRIERQFDRVLLHVFKDEM